MSGGVPRTVRRAALVWAGVARARALRGWRHLRGFPGWRGSRGWRTRLGGLPAVRAAGAAVALAVLAAGCVSVPTSGHVQSVSIGQPGTGQGQEYLQPIPVPPGHDWTPQQIVSGFLAANVSFAGNHAVAREYLVPAASRTWHPGWSVNVYAQDPALSTLTAARRPAPGRPGETTVVASGQMLGSLTRSGQYVISPGNQGTATEKFVLAKDHGQWRIASLPDHLVLSESDFRRVYQPRYLYFFGPSRSVLVPDPVYVPLAATPTDLVTGLVRALMPGPAGWLSGATQTAFPPGTTLLSDVTLDGGTAIVDLGGTAAGASGAVLREISAQVLWTLAGSPNDQPAIQSVELETDGRPRVLPGSPGPAQLMSWYQSYVPSASSSASFYYIDGRGAVEVMPSASSRGGAAPHGSPVPGQAGTGQVPLAKIAVSLDRRYVAGLSPGGAAVYTGALAGSAALAQRMNGGPFTSLSWDSHDDLWVAGASGVWMLPAAGGAAIRADGALPPGWHVTALRVAPDGVRCAMIVTGSGGSRLMLGAIIRTGQRAYIDATVPISATGSHFTALTWYDANHVIALSQTPGGPELEEVPVNGGDPYSFPASQGSVSVAADGTANPLVAGLSDGQMVTLASLGGLWSGAVGTGSDPVYPG